MKFDARIRHPSNHFEKVLAVGLGWWHSPPHATCDVVKENDRFSMGHKQVAGLPFWLKLTSHPAIMLPFVHSHPPIWWRKLTEIPADPSCGAGSVRFEI